MKPRTDAGAHERLASRVLGTVHRPLDKPTLPKVGYENVTVLDAEVDGEDDALADCGALN